MREANFSNFALNRAAIVITNNTYDRRALDSTSNLPLSISLSNLLTLCNASKKIREQISKDGAVEQLVCILRNRKYKNMQNKIWSLAFRCLAITAIRGNGKIRRKIIYSGTIPIIVERLLLNFQKVVEQIQKEQIEMYLSYQTESPQLVSGNEHSDTSVNDNTSNASYLNDEVNVNAPFLYSTFPKYQSYIYNEIAYNNDNVNVATALSPLMIAGARRRRRSSGSSSYSSLMGSPTQGKSQQELLSFYCYKQNIVKYMWHHVKKQGQNTSSNNANGSRGPNGLDNIREEETNESVAIQQGTSNLDLIANPIPQPQPVTENVNTETTGSVDSSDANNTTTNGQAMNGNVYKILNLSEIYPSIFKKLKYSVDDFVLALKMIACTCKYSDLRSIMSNQSHMEHDIYQLIEFFTTSSHPPEIRYWATIIMRNAFKKNSQNLRMCSNLNCLKMESYPREFSKCGRCQVNAYCSRECQKAAWITGHRHWCVDHSTIQQFNSAAANASATNRNLHANPAVSAATVAALAQQQQQQMLVQQAIALQRQQQLQQQTMTQSTTPTSA